MVLCLSGAKGSIRKLEEFLETQLRADSAWAEVPIFRVVSDEPRTRVFIDADAGINHPAVEALSKAARHAKWGAATSNPNKIPDVTERFVDEPVFEWEGDHVFGLTAHHHDVPTDGHVLAAA